MKRTVLWRVALMLMVLTAFAATSFAATVTVEVSDSGGAPIAGVNIKYDKGNGIYAFGTTDAAGQVSRDDLTVGKEYGFYAEYDFSTSASVYKVIADGDVIAFQTVNAKVKVEDQAGNPIEGAAITYGPGYYKAFGTTDATGYATRELLSGKSLQFYANINHTRAATQSAVVSDADPLVLFSTSLVTLHFKGKILIDAGALYSFTAPSMQLFPGDVKFRFEYGPWNDKKIGSLVIPVPDNDIEKTIAMLYLIDHNGDPLDGGTVRGGIYSPTTWHVIGATSSAGVLMDCVNGQPIKLYYEMKYNNTTAKKYQVYPVKLGSFFQFQTDLLTLRLETCGGDPLDGGKARFGKLNVYTSWWFPAGATGESAPGETAAEIFHGTYSFEMMYQGSAQKKLWYDFYPDIVPGSEVAVWQTSAVTLNYSSPISYGGATGDSKWFTKPTMQLLPGKLTFHFRDSGQRMEFDIDGCSYEKTIVIIKVLDCEGNGVPKMYAKWYWWGSASTKYDVPGHTDDSGCLVHVMDGPGGSMVYQVTHYNKTQSVGPQNPADNSFFTFQMQKAVVRLVDSQGSPISYDKTMSLYAWGYASDPASLWMEDGVAEICLFPGKYGFTLSYHFTTDTMIAENIDSDVVFQTGFVEDGGWECNQFYQWGNASDPKYFDRTTGMELLPSTCVFKNKQGESKMLDVVAGMTLNLMTETYGAAKMALLCEVTAVEQVDLPEVFALSDAYPNPFNPSATIEFALPADSYVRLSVYNIMGQQVADLIDEQMGAGYHAVTFDAGDLSAGIYIYRLHTGSELFSKKMTLVK